MGAIQFILGSVSPWLLPFAWLIDGYVLDMIQLCTNDPPALPTFDFNDVGNLLGTNGSAAQQTSAAKINQLSQHRFWWANCGCISGTLQVTEGGYPTQPAGIVIPTANGPGACASGSSQVIPRWLFPPTTFTTNTEFPGLLPVGPQPNRPFTDANGTVLFHPIPTTGITSVLISGTYVPSVISHLSPVGAFALMDVNGTVSFLPDPLNAQFGIGNFQQSALLQIPASAVWWYFAAQYQFPGDQAPSTPTRLRCDAYCGNAVPGSQTQACVTDPNVLNMLRAILDQETNILSAIPKRPTSFVPCGTSPPLFGAGSTGIGASAIAVRLGVQGAPLTIGSRGSSPQVRFGLGYVTPVTAFGPYPSTRWMTDGQIISLPLLTTSLEYDLAPQTTLIVEQLCAGP